MFGLKLIIDICIAKNIILITKVNNKTANLHLFVIFGIRNLSHIIGVLNWSEQSCQKKIFSTIYGK